MKKLIYLVLLLTSAGSLNAQSNTSEIKEYLNLRYVDEEEVLSDSLQKLNLVMPVSGQESPLFIWIGGGAWSYVDRFREMDFARRMAKEGIAVASIGHRLSPATWVNPALNTGIEHPEHIKDVAASVKWLLDHADEYGYSKKNIFIGGFSSGAHLAALICMDDSYLSKHGVSTKVFKGVIPVAGTFDIPDYYNTISNSSSPELGELHVKAVFGQTEEGFLNASPNRYLESLSTPMLLMSDNNMRNYTRLFEKQLEALKFKDFQVVYSSTMTHADFWNNLSFDDKSEHCDQIIAFIKSHVSDGKL